MKEEACLGLEQFLLEDSAAVGRRHGQEMVRAGGKVGVETGEAETVLQYVSIFFRAQFTGREAGLEEQQPELIGRAGVTVSGPSGAMAGCRSHKDNIEIRRENIVYIDGLRR